MSSSLRAVWESVPVEPDPGRDLGYGAEPLTIIDTREAETEGEVIVLPSEENQLQADEFIVAGPGVVESLEDWV